jgi:hypothetical protein
MKLRVAALAAILFASGAAAVMAQTPQPTPTPVVVPSLPPTGQIINDVIQAVTNQVTSSYGWNPNRVHGTVTYFRRYDMQVQMQLDKFRNVHLHQGTVINPRGATPSQGQVVDVVGHPDPDGTLEADVITVH